MSPTSGGSQSAQHAQPLLVVRPRFIPQVVVTSNMKSLAYITTAGASFCSGFFDAFASKQGIDIPVWILLALFSPFVLLGAVALVLHMTQRLYAQTEYRFYHDRLEYERGRRGSATKAIPYPHIAEVLCEQGLMQQRHEVGTIVLMKPRRFLCFRPHKLELRDIPNPGTVHTQVKALVHETVH